MSNMETVRYERDAADIDTLAPTKSLIDLSNDSDEGEFGLDNYTLTHTLGDIILCEYVDTNAQGEVMRNGVVIVGNKKGGAWRKARVLIVGSEINDVKVDDIVIIPGDRGLKASNIKILDANDSAYTVKEAVFVNEERLFGICRPH